MAYNLIQVKDKQETTAVVSIQVTLDSKPVEGNLLVCFVATQHTEIPVKPDNGWQAGSNLAFSGIQGRIFYKIAGSDESKVISSNVFGGFDETSMMVAEFENTSGEFFLGIDRFSTNSGTSTSLSVGPTSVTRRSNELSIAAFAANGGNGGWDQTFSSGFAEIATQGAGTAGDITITMAFKESSVSEAISTTTGQGSANDFIGVIQTFGTKQEPSKVSRKIELVQTATQQETIATDTITATLSSAPTEGNLLVLMSGSMAGSDPIEEIQHIAPDPSWLEHIFVKNTDGSSSLLRQTVKIFTKIATSGESPSVTITTGHSEERSLILAEFSGNFIADDLLDVSASSFTFNPNLTTATTGTTPESAREGLAVALFCRPGGGAGWSGNYTNGFRNIEKLNVASSGDVTMAAAYLITNESKEYVSSTSINIASYLFGTMVVFNNLVIQPDPPEQVGIKTIGDGCVVADCNVATLTYPVGGEVISSREIDITWHTPSPHSESGTPLWYELFFTENYDFDKLKQDWHQIASIPVGNESFIWKVPFSIKSKKCRLAIRCRDHRGLRGPLMVASDNFTITDRRLLSPAIFSPNNGDSYKFFVPIIFDNDAILGTQSQRSTYQIFYSSEKNNIDWTLIAQNVPVGSPPIFFDIRDIPYADDYILKVLLTDDSGDSSVPLFIRNLKFSPLNFFILDTTPPKGTVVIENNIEFINKRDIILRLVAFDEATGVQSVTLQQREDDSLTLVRADQEYSNINTWSITGDDGAKRIEALFKDYAGNVPIQESGQRAFRQYLSNESIPIGALLLVKSGTDLQVWTAFGGDEPVLFLNQSVAFSLDGEATSLELFNFNVYVAIKTTDNTGILQRIVANDIDEVNTFTEFDSVINTMTVFDNKLYIGLQNGEIYIFDGTMIYLLQDMGSAVNKLSSDNSLLYVFLDNTEDITIYDGLNFTNAGVVNGSHQI